MLRRLSGERTETSAVFNLATQFGGGKTHALTLLYHLAKHGPEANDWTGVRKLLERAGVPSVPKAAVAVFVGTEFDSFSGRGGDDGTPYRRTPWGEIAFQLGGVEAFNHVAAHEAIEVHIAEAGEGFGPRVQGAQRMFEDGGHRAALYTRRPSGHHLMQPWRVPAVDGGKNGKRGIGSDFSWISCPLGSAQSALPPEAGSLLPRRLTRAGVNPAK